MFCCVQAKKSPNSGAKSEQRTPKPATARDLALSPWQSVEVGRWVGGCYRLSLQSVSSQQLLCWLVTAKDAKGFQDIPSLCEDQGALTASAVSICYCHCQEFSEWLHNLSSDLSWCAPFTSSEMWRDGARILECIWNRALELFTISTTC